MDKKIILKMLPSKSIDIYIEGGSSITISKDDRSVKADDIYKLIDFSRGDKYTVETQNEENVDVPVLKFFEELLLDIVEKLNRIADLDEDEFLTEIVTDKKTYGN